MAVTSCPTWKATRLHGQELEHALVSCWKYYQERRPILVIEFEFFVRGLPVATQYQQTKFGVIYNKGRAVAWRKTVAQEAVVAAGAGYKPQSGMVALSLDFYFPIPKSRKELRVGDPHLQDPDCTNLLKNCEDGLKRVLFTDDCMVCSLQVSKSWTEAGKEGVQVLVTIT